MVSFIVYDDDSSRRDLCSKVIKKFLFSTNDYYKIIEFDKYNFAISEKMKHIEGARVYIINVDVSGPNPLNIARKIREDGDFISPIILITNKNKTSVIDDIQNVLFLDIIEMDNNFISNMYNCLKNAHKIVTRHSVYTFSVFDEVYRIPYKDIYFIKKNLKDDSVTIYTKDDSYLHYITVKALEKMLKKDPRFFKAHRSCIINLYNVSSYDKKCNIVVFKNGMTVDLVSRQNKSILAQKLKEYSNV